MLQIHFNERNSYNVSMFFFWGFVLYLVSILLIGRWQASINRYSRTKKKIAAAEYWVYPGCIYLTIIFLQIRCAYFHVHSKKYSPHFFYYLKVQTFQDLISFHWSSNIIHWFGLWIFQLILLPVCAGGAIIFSPNHTGDNLHKSAE